MGARLLGAVLAAQSCRRFPLLRPGELLAQRSAPAVEYGTRRRLEKIAMLDRHGIGAQGDDGAATCQALTPRLQGTLDGGVQCRLHRSNDGGPRGVQNQQIDREIL